MLAVLVAVAAALSLAEAALIYYGTLPPLLSYSPGNLVFVLLRFAVILYAVLSLAKNSIAKSASIGALLGFTSIFVFLLAARTIFSGPPMLGIAVPNIESLYLMFALVLVGNTALGAIFAAAAAWAAGIAAKKPAKQGARPPTKKQKN